MKKALYIEVLVAVTLAIGTVAYFQLDKPASVPTPETTTTTVEVNHCDNDAKLCPDGSTVLREGERCDFAACPSMFGEVRDWHDRKDPGSGISFKYPTTLGSQYVTAREWPPSVRVSKGEVACEDSNENSVVTYTKIFKEKTYCIFEAKEGAAGSTYTTYKVSLSEDQETTTFEFTIQTPQCMNYDGGEQSACQAAQEAFDVVELVAGIIATITK